jgi:hypothetical protein
VNINKGINYSDYNMSESVLIGHAVSAGSSASNMYDLTPVMAPYFDVHMVNPLLDHLREV